MEVRHWDNRMFALHVTAARQKMEKRKRIISGRRTARRIAEAVAEDYDETEREKKKGEEE